MIKLNYFTIFLPALLYAYCYEEIGNIRPVTLAKAFSVLSTFDAITCALFPITAFSWFGIKIEKHSIDHFLSKVIGAHASGLAITSYLMTTQETTIEKAMAYGHIARIFIAVSILTTHKPSKLGGDCSICYVVLSIIAGVVFNLLNETWKPLVCAKLVAMMMCFGGVRGMINPVATAKFVAKFDLKEKTSQDLTRFAGMYVFLNGIYLNMICNNMDPIKSVGLTSLVLLPFTYYIENTEMKGPFGISKEFMIVSIVMVLGVISAGILL